LEIAQIRKQMTMLTEVFKSTAPAMRKMASTHIASAKNFFDAKELGIPAYLVTIASDQFKQAEDGTVWDAYNALTFAITHKMRHANPELATRLGKNAWAAAKARLRR